MWQHSQHTFLLNTCHSGPYCSLVRIAWLFLSLIKLIFFALATITAFTAPLIYLQNQEFIDEKIRQGNELVNEQLNTGRELTVKYAGEAAARARSTAVDLSQKAQGYAQNVRGSSPAATSKPSTTSTADKKEFPSVPVHDPAANGHNGLNGVNGHNDLNGANGANGFNTKVQDEYRPEQPILA